jgi:cytochrome c
MDTTADAVSILRLMIAPFGSRIEAKALIHAVEELSKRNTLPAENEKIRASRDRWRECCEQFVDGLTQDDDKKLAHAIKAYRKLIKIPAETGGTESSQQVQPAPASADVHQGNKVPRST